jgi:hypothetical protein
MNIKPGEFVECSYAELQAIHKKTLRDHERLVAAAPEMLEFLQALNSMGGLGLDVHRQLDALIAKATGSKP